MAEAAIAPESMTRRVRRMTIAVAATGLVSGALLGVLDPHLSLLAVAFVLGWTRLVSL